MMEYGESGVRPLCYIAKRDSEEKWRIGMLTYYPEHKKWTVNWDKKQYDYLRECYQDLVSPKNDLPIIGRRKFCRSFLRGLGLDEVINIDEVYDSLKE